MILENSYISFVNLDHRTDRLEKMQATLRWAGLEATRTPGVLPDAVPWPRHRTEIMRKRTPGAIGCHFTQCQIMLEASARGKHAFVMEDDLIICDDFKQRMAIVDQFCETHPWDVIWMGGTYHVNPPYWHKDDLGKDAELTDHPRIIRTYGAFSTHAYIVNNASLDKIINLLEQELDTTIGIDYSFIQFQPLIYAYAFAPGMIIQYDNMSDIGKGMTYFSHFGKKLGPYWWQKKMEHFDPTTYNWHEAIRKP